MDVQKIVYLKFGVRNKRVRFQSQAGKSDTDCLREAIVAASRTDADLRRRLDGCLAILQKEIEKKSTKDKILVDIEESEDIDDEEQLTLVFSPIEPSSSANAQPSENLSVCTPLTYSPKPKKRSAKVSSVLESM